MDGKTKLTLATAVVGGYVLGRTKKGRLALTVATFFAGQSLDPRKLLVEGLRRLSKVPQIADVNKQLKGEVLTAGRTAVTAAATRRLGSLTDNLRDRTLKLQGLPAQEEEQPQDEEEPAEEEPAEEEEAEEPEAENEEEEEEEGEEEPEEDSAPPHRRTTSGQAEGGRGKRTPGKGAERAAPKKKAASPTTRKAAAKKSPPARKSASAKKTSAKKSSSRPHRGR